mmetsp:Transcript_6613/g.9168  ORF Transcript_6613/g.9168 Transcript_6613/m.9168 type:complete len:164 (+) Transcript_6613:790-1281(+)
MLEHRNAVQEMCRLSTDIVNIVIDYVDESRATNIRNIVTVCYSEQKVAKFYIDYYKFLEKSLGLYESGENAKLGSGDESESKGDSPENISFKRNILVLNDPSLMKKLLLKEEWEGADKYYIPLTMKILGIPSFGGNVKFRPENLENILKIRLFESQSYHHYFH